MLALGQLLLQHVQLALQFVVILFKGSGRAIQSISIFLQARSLLFRVKFITLKLNKKQDKMSVSLTLFGLGRGGRGRLTPPKNFKNPLLITNDCVYCVPISWLFLKFTWEQFGVVRFW